MLVRTVTPRMSGASRLASAAVLAAASRATFIISTPPDVWIVSICTPNRVALATALATVFGISWNFRSRNTDAPVSRTCFTMSGPALVNSSLPILKAATTGAIRPASFKAASAVGTSKAAIIGLRTSGVKRTNASATRLNPVLWVAGSTASSGRLDRRRTRVCLKLDQVMITNHLERAEVGRLPHLEAVRQAHEGRRFPGKSRPGFAPGTVQHARSTEDTVDGPEGRAREKLRSGTAHHLVRANFHLHFSEFVTACWHSCGRHRVGRVIDTARHFAMHQTE